jgi:hypothetical protein
MRRIILHTAFSAIALLMACDAWALPSYKDDSWGVVPQDNGQACVVVLNSEDRLHAFHFAVDGPDQAATIGILDDYVPERLSVSATKITVDLGPSFVRQLEFKHHSSGSMGYLAADLSRDDLKSILTAFQSDSRVSLSFANGEVWRIPGPKQEATAAIAQCWDEALSGAHITKAALHAKTRFE